MDPHGAEVRRAAHEIRMRLDPHPSGRLDANIPVHVGRRLTGLQFDTVRSVRIGTKSLALWPYRFLTDRDADDLLRLFEKVVAGGRHLALMAHFTHPQELRPPVVREAMRRVRDTGAVIRCQGPLVAGINDSAEAWAELWEETNRAGGGAVLPVRGAGHRPAGLLRGAAGPRPRDLP
ncbi:hypothetical protein ACWC2T_25725 [Streptomyces sp. NPDC001393]